MLRRVKERSITILRCSKHLHYEKTEGAVSKLRDGPFSCGRKPGGMGLPDRWLCFTFLVTSSFSHDCLICFSAYPRGVYRRLWRCEFILNSILFRKSMHFFPLCWLIVVWSNRSKCFSYGMKAVSVFPLSDMCRYGGGGIGKMHTFTRYFLKRYEGLPAPSDWTL